jgi:signal transduction histidine kinase
VVVQAEAAEELLDGHPERARESLQTIQRMSREALAEMRNVLGIMRDPSGEAPPAPQPTLDGLPALIARHRALGLPAGLRVEGTPRPLPPGLAVSAYRVVQESLTNVRKHAGGAPAHVTVTFTPHSLELEIADHGGDNGRGDGSGHGLPGMEERVRFFGGQFTAGSRPDGGFVVRASFPIPASSQR